MLDQISRLKRERLRASIEKKFRRDMRSHTNYSIDVDGETITSDRITKLKVLEVKLVDPDGISAKVAFTIRNLGVVVQEVEFGLTDD